MITPQTNLERTSVNANHNDPATMKIVNATQCIENIIRGILCCICKLNYLSTKKMFEQHYLTSVVVTLSLSGDILQKETTKTKPERNTQLNKQINLEQNPSV